MARLEPVLAQLRDQTQETVIVGKRQGTHIVYLCVLEGPQTIRYSSQVGALKPLHSSAIGKALLGALDPAERMEVVKHLPLERITAATITDRNTLLADLDRGCKQGYFVTAGENVADVMAVAAPVRLGSEVYGIAVAGPMHRMERVLTEQMLALVAACTTITHMLTSEPAHRRTG